MRFFIILMLLGSLTTLAFGSGTDVIDKTPNCIVMEDANYQVADLCIATTVTMSGTSVEPLKTYLIEAVNPFVDFIEPRPEPDKRGSILSNSSTTVFETYKRIDLHIDPGTWARCV